MENTQSQSQPEKKPTDQQTDKSTPENDLTKQDVPDSSNESTGVPGSGQRQDSN